MGRRSDENSVEDSILIVHFKEEKRTDKWGAS